MSHPLIVNLADGSTERFDLTDKSHFAKWRALQRERMGSIRAVTLKSGRVLHALPVPRTGFSRVVVDAERVLHRTNPGKEIGTRITVFADEVSVSVLVYDGERPPLVKTTLERTGRPVYLPHLSRD